MDQKLKGILSVILEVKEEDINDSSSMENIETWDSLKHLELITAIEEHFSITFNIEEIIGMTKFSAVKSALRGRGVELR